MINRMEGELTCSICLELYTTPLMLPCTHNFCEQCIQGLVRHGGGARTFACPTCRREVVQDRSFLSSLPVNRSLNQVVKAFIKEKESNTLAASMCFLHNEPRNLFCTTCKTDMCQKCLQKDESHLRFGHHVAAVEELITEEKRKLNPVVEEAKRLQGDIHEKQRQIKAEEESIKRKLNPVVEEAKRLQGDIHEKQRQIKAEEESIKVRIMMHMYLSKWVEFHVSPNMYCTVTDHQ
ncbi:tripartite motif-containing 13 [Lingula anatina]|uniref:Tripartite motif-containing 13 n=1 Tax=Lingula anatina TaxID=7574 RepID=A0A1S3IXJ7_LINAN|nr:tripartite motif-containing 13 [Lingula anatina]|eukprot:XP_013402269.1 tripartite motif-containing 13 [Lingula anatina]